MLAPPGGSLRQKIWQLRQRLRATQIGSAMGGAAKIRGPCPIWDSGASHHLASDPALVSNKSSSAITHITGIAGNQAKIDAAGTLGSLSHVLVAPDVGQNIISVGSFLDQHGGSMIFTASDVLHKRDEEVVKVGTRR